MFTQTYEINEMKYVSMNEADSLFSKEVSVLKVPYVDPLFFGIDDVKFMIPRSHGMLKNDMQNEMCYM